MVTPKRMLAITLFGIWCLWGYIAIQQFVILSHPYPLTLALPGEAHIPFIPEMGYSAETVG